MSTLHRLFCLVAFTALAATLLPGCADQTAGMPANGWTNNTGPSMNVGFKDTNPGYYGITSATGAGVMGPGSAGAP